MGKQRLNNIMVLHVHKELTDQLNLVNIAYDFVRGSDSPNLQFGRFEESTKGAKGVHSR